MRFLGIIIMTTVLTWACTTKSECVDQATQLESEHITGDSFIRVCSNEVSIDYPEAVTFRFAAESDRKIESVRLVVTNLQRRCGSPYYTTQPKYQPGKYVNAVYRLPARQADNLVPGTALSYFWRVATDDGVELETPPVTIVIEDNRFTWKVISDNRVIVLWYEGTEQFADDLRRQASETLSYLEEVFKVGLEGVVRVYVYAAVDDLQSGLFEPTEWIGGVSFTDSNVIAIAVDPNALDTGKVGIAHEISHLAIRAASFNCNGRLPPWLTEGIATIVEGGLHPTSEALLARAVVGGEFFSIGRLASTFPDDPVAADLAYAQSYSMVLYLLDCCGVDKLSELLAAFSEVAATTLVFPKVYGFDLQQFERNWARDFGQQ